MNLARFAFWIFDALPEKKRAINGISQSHRGGDIAFQGRYDARNGASCLAASGNNGSYSQGYSDNPVQAGKAGRVFEIGNGEGYRGHLNVLAPQLNNSGVQSINNLGHGRCILSLKTRFGRSCQAFVNAWRAP